jgi:hypothetical protein
MRPSHLALALLCGGLTTAFVAWLSALFVDLYHAAPNPSIRTTRSVSRTLRYIQWDSATASGILSFPDDHTVGSKSERVIDGPTWSRTCAGTAITTAPNFAAHFEDARGWPMRALLSSHNSTDMSMTAWTTRNGIT